MSNYQQPDFRNPTPATVPTVANAINGDFVGTGTTRAANFVEPGLSDRDDPHGTWRGIKKS